jgi:hypothetical protein
MRFWLATSALGLLVFSTEGQQRTTGSAKSASSPGTSRHGFDELTLAGLRPGRDAMVKAERLQPGRSTPADQGTSRSWRDACRRVLSVIADSNGTILQVTATQGPGAKTGCLTGETDPWVTGHGLALGNSCSRVVALYGQPGSRGPSTKAGQQLELLYYAFDWAGTEVPQLMAVLCTPEKNGKAGSVVEITLEAPSL